MDIIREHSIFRQLSEAGIKPVAFANTYTKRFFANRPRWISATTAAVEAASNALSKDVRTPIVNSPGATAYPISGLTFLLVYRDQKDPAKGKALVDFIRWAMGEGQTYADDLSYAKLPDAVIKVNRAMLGSLTSNGKKLLASN